jgi:hypothetical protein
LTPFWSPLCGSITILIVPNRCNNSNTAIFLNRENAEFQPVFSLKLWNNLLSKPTLALFRKNKGDADGIAGNK